MNIIFLDIDGVLNTSDSFKEEYYKSKELNRIRIYPIDEDRLSYLVEIVKLTNAKIVLTSSNRVNFIKINNKLEKPILILKSSSNEIKYELVLDNDNEHVYRHIDVADIKRAETEQLVKLKELEIKEKEKEYKGKMVKVKIMISLFLAAIGVVMMILGNTMGTESGDSNSGWYMVSMIGFFPFMGAAYIWLFSIGDKKE